MNFIEQLNATLDQHHILKHPFYQAWNSGDLSIEDLQAYAAQYFHHVDAFPRYISATHTNCESLTARQVLLENLVEEEQGPGNHPELWLQFAEGLGMPRESVINQKLLPETQAFIDTFMNLSKSSYAEGLGALYAYERQTPEVAHTKINGLKSFYGIEDEATLKFFNVHAVADIEHADDTRALIEQLDETDSAKAAAAGEAIVKGLWNVLSGIQAITIDAREDVATIH